MERIEKAVLRVSLLIVILLGIDIIDDLAHGSDLTHVLLEGMAFALAAEMVIRLTRSAMKSLRRSRELTGMRMQKLVAERNQWRARAQRYLVGLGEAIYEQFRGWNLTESEREVGLLILKGFSHKEIALHRATSEQTVRQQAAALYAKANVENKSQLSAFFLEDLMLPDRASERDAAPGGGVVGEEPLPRD